MPAPHDAVNDAAQRRRLKNALRRRERKQSKKAAETWPTPPVGLGVHIRESDDIIVSRRVDDASDRVNHTNKKAPTDWQKVVDNLKCALDGLCGADEVVSLLKSKGLRYVDWDGTTLRRIVDGADGCIVAALAGRPMSDPTWDEAVRDAGGLLAELRPRLGAHPDEDRGQFYQLRAGPSYGGGQRMPQQKSHDKAQAAVVEALSTAKAFQRIAGFQNSVAATFQPKACRLGRQVHSALRDKYASALNSRFTRGIWSGVAWNFPPQAVCLPHRDSQNPAGFPCVVTSGGAFDSSAGGMIVLWDLGLFVRFPAGSTVMLTSGDCTHFNVPVGEGEERWSMTQYMSGPLITWVRRGFRKEQELTAEEKAMEAAKHELRQVRGRRLYSTRESLREDRLALERDEGDFL